MKKTKKKANLKQTKSKKVRKLAPKKRTKKTNQRKSRKTKRLVKKITKSSKSKIKTKTKKLSKTRSKVIATVVPEVIEDMAIQPEDIVASKIISDAIEEKKATMYFTQDTEMAIVEYNNETDKMEREKIYNTRIKHAFEKIAENIFNTYKFSYNEVSSAAVQQEALSHMVMNMEKYDRSKGKAFGYFSIVAKHWFILENNNNYKRFKKQVEIVAEPGSTTGGEFVVSPEHETRNRDNQEFIRLMVDYWDANIESIFPKKRDYRIAGAVVDIFRLCDRIEMFNKKALYLYIRDNAGCQTQHITKVINRMLFIYKNLRREYLNSGIITGEYCSCQNYLV